MLSNGVTVFGNFIQQLQLQDIVLENSILWEDHKGFAKAPEGEELQIELVDQALIDQTIDRLHKQSQLKWTTRPFHLCFLVFCVWKYVSDDEEVTSKKGRVVVDIRASNQFVIPNAIIELTEMEPQRAHSEPATERTVEVYPIKLSTSGKNKPAMIEAVNAIKFLAMFMKWHYDKQNKPIFFRIRDYISLRIHKDYNVPGFTERNTEIEQQFAGLFKVFERIGRLAYQVELPESMKICHVTSVAHLEPASNPTQDPYHRPFAVGILQNPELLPERILRNREKRRRAGGILTEYLIGFRGRTAEWDKWELDRRVQIDIIKAFEEEN